MAGCEVASVVSVVRRTCFIRFILRNRVSLVQ